MNNYPRRVFWVFTLVCLSASATNVALARSGRAGDHPIKKPHPKHTTAVEETVTAPVVEEPALETVVEETVITPLVEEPASETVGSAFINWNPPTQNVDGSPTMIAGYNLYRLITNATPCPSDINLYTGLPPTEANNLATIVGSPPAPSFSDNGLEAGSYCYGVTALNISAQESIPAFLENPLTTN